jgi:hypothetical protein
MLYPLSYGGSPRSAPIFGLPEITLNLPWATFGHLRPPSPQLASLCSSQHERVHVRAPAGRLEASSLRRKRSRDGRQAARLTGVSLGHAGELRRPCPSSWPMWAKGAPGSAAMTLSGLLMAFCDHSETLSRPPPQSPSTDE